jgi:hypothetical protein
MTSVEMTFFERMAVAQMARELCELINVAVPGETVVGDKAAADTDDPFAFWEQDSELGSINHDDPAIIRLFPSAYDTSDADEEYHRFTEPQLRTALAEQAAVLLGDLQAVPDAGGEPTHRDLVPVSDPTAWLKTLNALRLVLAARLGVIDDASSDALLEVEPDDERFPTIQIYLYLGYLLEMLIDALMES